MAQPGSDDVMVFIKGHGVALVLILCAAALILRASGLAAAASYSAQ
jgi:hypothetical protein